MVGDVAERSGFNRASFSVLAVVGGVVSALGLTLFVLAITAWSVWSLDGDAVTPSLLHAMASFFLVGAGCFGWLVWGLVAVVARPRKWWVWLNLGVAVLTSYWVMTHPMWVIEFACWMLGKRVVLEAWK